MRLHHFREIAVLSVLAFTLGCSSNQPGTASRQMTDEDLEKNVQARFQLDNQLKAYDIDVDANVDQNRITLSGDVPSQELRSRAVQLAKEAGPNLTITDELDVKPGEIERSAYTEDMARDTRQRASSAGEKVGDSLDDAWIHTKIRTKLAGAGEFPLGGINVDVVNKVVTLRGSVDNQQARAEAERIAKDTEGVARVNNQLVLKKG